MSVGYLELLRINPNFRHLWLGQVVSLLGDWFDTIAIFTLVLQITGSAESAGLLTLSRFLPSVLVGPSAGVVVDRVNRLRVLIATDILRAVIVLGFLFVRRPEDLWIVYVVTVLQFAVASFFEPARTALLPTVTRPEELVSANALSAVTWSTMLTLGGAIGGIITHYVGVRTAFMIDSGTFIVSALILARIRLPKQPPRIRHPFSWGRITGYTDLREGARYIRRHPAVQRLLFIKPAWSLASGGLILLLTLMGDRVFRIGGDASAGMGILYTARGIGTALGPVLTRKIAGNDPVKMRRAIGPAFLVAGGFYLLLGFSPSLGWAVIATAFAHMGGSVLWVHSTVLLQQTAPNEFRGRVFATELVAQTLTLSLSTYLAGLAVDHLHLSIRGVITGLAAITFLSALIWEFIERRRKTDQVNTRVE